MSTIPPGGAPPPPPRRGLRPGQAVALALALVLLLVAIAAAIATRGDDGSASADPEREVFAEPINSTRNPFAPPVGDDYSNMPAVRPQSFSTQTGGQPGLYGGTMQQASCNKQQLITYLEANPDKAAAWASTIGVQVSQIRAYVNSLTSVLLRADTRVTNHGFLNGRVTSFHAVLQAGTAVLVDDKGAPVTKCYCGNPLTPPVASPPRYSGPKWSGFDPSGLTVVVENTVVVDVFTLVDATTGITFDRPARTDGEQDRRVGGTPAPDSPTTTTTVPQPVTQVEYRALAKFERAARECYPFPGIEQDIAEERTTSPGPGAGSLTLRVVGTTRTGGTQTFTWRVDKKTLVFEPLNELARLVSEDCAVLASPD